MNIKLLLGTCALLIAGLSQAQIPTNGLVLYLPFTGDANDASSSGTNGTVYNATLTSDRFGNSNSAYSFIPGNNTYIQFPVTNVKTNTFTYSLWAYLYSLPTNGTIQFLLDIGGGTVDQSINIQNNYLGSSTGWGGGGYNTSSPNFPLQQRTNPNDSTWYHLVYLRDSKFAKLYIDGKMVDSVGSSSVKYPDYGTGTVGFVGKRHDNTTPFNGKIDDITIHNRALSDSEIQQLFKNNTAGLTELKPSAIAVYPNPTAGKLFISDPDAQVSHVIITDICGKVIHNEQSTTPISSIDFGSNQSKGIYFLQMLNKNGTVSFSGKVILQ